MYLGTVKLRSQGVMAWIHGKAFGLFLPALTDGLVLDQAFERFVSFREIIGHQKGLQIFFQVVMSFVVIPSPGGLFARTVHPFHLAMGPGIVGYGQPVVKTMLMTDAIKDMMKGVNIAFTIRALDAVIGQHRMQLGIDKLTGAGKRDKQGKLAFFRAHFSHSDVEVPDRIACELFLPGFIALDGWQATAAVPLQTTVER